VHLWGWRGSPFSPADASAMARERIQSGQAPTFRLSLFPCRRVGNRPSRRAAREADRDSTEKGKENSMAVLEWSDKYSVHIAVIDRQHKKLIGLVGTLRAAMREGKGKQALSEVLKELIQYTKTHFSAEEGIMKEHGYPEYAEHKVKHDKMTQKVLDIQKQYQEGKITITLDLMTFLEDWVDKHILGTDMRYSAFLIAKGVK
jgi:hemerythrin